MHKDPRIHRLVVAMLIAFSLVFGTIRTAQGKKPPRRLVFASKAGDVNFDHAAHLKREKGACTACHDGLWQKSTKVPVKSSTGCASCHRIDGKSFEMKGHCARCHVSKVSANTPEIGHRHTHR